MTERSKSAVVWILSTALIAALSGCSTFSSFDPTPLEEVPFIERATSQTRDGLSVRTAVLSHDEARAIFGVELADKHIQPVWFELTNESDIPYAFLLTGLDPNYFSAHEASYRNHFKWRGGTNRKMDAHFETLQLDTLLLPGDTDSGFVLTNLKLGTKEVRVRLFGPGRVEDFDFYSVVPGFKADYHEVDWEALHARESTDFETESELREALRQLPCCTTKANGKGAGDPLNLVIIGEPHVVAAALTRSGWDETEKLSAASAWRTFKAFWGGEYKYSPMSSLYFEGRSQDAGFQKARDTIHQRNHLRLWLSDMTFRGRNVWVGTITRDIGVYFTLRTWNLTTHAIDPYVDEARGSIVEDFANAQAINRFGYVGGVGAATHAEPHRNLMNAAWWTDGDRVVIDATANRVPMEDVEFLYWDWGMNAERTARINEMLRKARETTSKDVESTPPDEGS